MQSNSVCSQGLFRFNASKWFLFFRRFLALRLVLRYAMRLALQLVLQLALQFALLALQLALRLALQFASTRKILTPTG